MILSVIQNAQGLAVVKARSNLTGNVSERVFIVDKRTIMLGLARCSVGISVQKAFPGLAPNDWEFLKTGSTPEEWDEMFKED